MSANLKQLWVEKFVTPQVNAMLGLVPASPKLCPVCGTSAALHIGGAAPGARWVAGEGITGCGTAYAQDRGGM